MDRKRREAEMQALDEKNELEMERLKLEKMKYEIERQKLEMQMEELTKPKPKVIPKNPGLNQPLNDCARNTNDTNRLRDLVAQGGDLTSTNGAPWMHTPLHQSAYHNRPSMVKVLIELCREADVLK